MAYPSSTVQPVAAAELLSAQPTLEEQVASLLLERGLKLAVAESCTGGLLSHRLTNISGSAGYTVLNVVTYSNDAKQQLLGVSAETLREVGAVSEAVARQMALGCLALSGAHLALGITGIAGPTGGSEQKPVGLAYIGLAMKETQLIPPSPSAPLSYWDAAEPQNTRSTWCRVIRVMGKASLERGAMKQWFADQALELLLQTLLAVDSKA